MCDLLKWVRLKMENFIALNICLASRIHNVFYIYINPAVIQRGLIRLSIPSEAFSLSFQLWSKKPIHILWDFLYNFQNLWASPIYTVPLLSVYIYM